MRIFAPQQNQPQKPVSSILARPTVPRMLQPNAETNAELKAGLTTTASSRFGHDFSRIRLHAPAAGAIQTKSTINQPGDSYEQEADRVSEQVMSRSAPQLQRACACGGECLKCQTEQLGQEHARLHTKRVPASDTGQIATPPIVHEVLRSPGQPLDPSSRAFMEPRFGHDFSRVRVHADVPGLRQLKAAALTIGSDVAFAPGTYAPQTRRGQRLIAHELAHVLQYRASPVRADLPFTSQAGDVAERQADSIARQVSLGLPLKGWTPAAPSARLSLALETWFRGEAVGVPVIKDGGVVHDLGDGIYFTDRLDVAQEYAEMRAPKNPGAQRMLSGQIDPKSLGRVLDLTKEPDFMNPFNHVKRTLPNISGEPYRNLVEGFLKQKGLKLEDFDAIIGPEGIRGGKQLCVRNPEMGSKMRAGMLPVKPSGGGGGRGPGSTGGGGEPGGEGGGGARRAAPQGGSPAGTARAAEEAEVEVGKGAPRRTQRTTGAARSGRGPMVSGRQLAGSMAVNIGAAIALGIFQTEFKEKVKRDLDALPKPKVDKRGAREFLQDPSVKESMGLLDLFHKNFQPLGKQLDENQQVLAMTISFELAGLALASSKTQADLEVKLQRLSEIQDELSEYEELLSTILDNLEVISEKETKAREAQKAADELRELLKGKAVRTFLIYQGYTPEEILDMEGNLAGFSISIARAFGDASALKATVERLLEEERRLAKTVNQIWWAEFGAQLQLHLKERQRQREQAEAARRRQAESQTPRAEPQEAQPQFRNADERGLYYDYRAREDELLQQLGEIDKKAATLPKGASSQELHDQREPLLNELKDVREKLKKYQGTTKP